MNSNGPELEQAVHTVQQIVPERLAEEGLVLKILFTLVQWFIFAHFQSGGFQGFFFDVRSFTRLIENCKFRKALEIVEIQRNALCKSKAAIFALSSNPHS